MQKNNRCLGLDISSTTVGYCITESINNITHAGFMDISKTPSIKEKAHLVLDKIKSLNIQPTFVVVEEILSGFGGGRTSQQTIVKLAKCNAVISYVIESYFDLDVTYANVATIRKAVFGKSREPGVDSKIFVREQLENKIDLSEFIVYNSRKNYDKKNYDMMDAVVASLYHWYTIDN